VPTRPAAVAGLFYPADQEELRSTLESLMSAARQRSPSQVRASPVKALIVPHAGYRYSGPVAASGYLSLAASPAKVERVVLIGPAHRVATDHLAASGAERWATPLGSVAIDTRRRDLLVEQGLIVVDDRAHREEHSLEVQLPFVQMVAGDVPALPLLVGDLPAGQVADVLDALWDGPGTVIIASTDLSHYWDQETARRLDGETAAAICAAEHWRIEPDRACGAHALCGLLEAARRHGLGVRMLDLRTSGDTAGDLSCVVGYGAFAVG